MFLFKNLARWLTTLDKDLILKVFSDRCELGECTFLFGPICLSFTHLGALVTNDFPDQLLVRFTVVSHVLRESRGMIACRGGRKGLQAFGL